jgi:hypothetical protein
MASGGKQGAKMGAFGALALMAALVGPGVATVSAKPVAPARVTARTPLQAVMVAYSAPSVAEEALAPVVKPRHLRRLKQCDLNNDLIVASAELIKKHHGKRFGSQVEVEIAGKPYVARIERHFHPEGGSIKPWGFHPGVSLFAVE